jgi:hypothetical protein
LDALGFNHFLILVAFTIIEFIAIIAASIIVQVSSCLVFSS